MVPDATFASYYGRPVVKAAPWNHDIAIYLFAGGVAAGSSLLGAGADLSGRPVLRRTGRIAAAAAISVSLLALVKDLGRPERFVNMLRVFEADLADVGGHLDPHCVRSGRLSGRRGRGGKAAARRARCRWAACSAGPPDRQGWPRRSSLRPSRRTPRCCSPTPPLPAWHDAHRAAVRVRRIGRGRLGGLGMLLAPTAETGPPAGWP